MNASDDDDVASDEAKTAPPIVTRYNLRGKDKKLEESAK